MVWRPAPEHCMPYPEIVEGTRRGRPYRIIDTQDKKWLPTNGMTNKVDRQLLVPLCPGGRPISRHELAHVKWSPKRIPRVRYDPRVLLAVEDARINLGLDWLAIPVLLAAGDRAYIGSLAAEDLGRHDVAAFVLRAIASVGTNAEAEVLAAAEGAPATILRLAESLRERVRSRLLLGRQRRRGPVATFELVKRLGREVAHELAALGLLADRDPSHPGALAGAVCCLGDPAAATMDLDPRLAERLVRPRDLDSETTVPGRMKVVLARLDVATAAARGGRRRHWRPSSEGIIIRWMHRYPIDRAIFRRPVRERGGSVLVDTSGSMSLDADAIECILRDAPLATLVAIYSGRGSKGELRIVARGGRRASAKDLKPFGGGNIVDVPALEWLAKQPGPRIWISDGRVTGIGDLRSPGIDRRCRRICRRARIRRVKTAAEAARELEGRGGRS